MPFINVKLIEGVFTSEQKQEIVRKLTDTLVQIEGEHALGHLVCRRGGRQWRLGHRRTAADHRRRPDPRPRCPRQLSRDRPRRQPTGAD